MNSTNRQQGNPVLVSSMCQWWSRFVRLKSRQQNTESTQTIETEWRGTGRSLAGVSGDNTSLVLRVINPSGCWQNNTKTNVLNGTKCLTPPNVYPYDWPNMLCWDREINEKAGGHAESEIRVTAYVEYRIKLSQMTVIDKHLLCSGKSVYTVSGNTATSASDNRGSVKRPGMFWGVWSPQKLNTQVFEITNTVLA